MRNFLTNSVFFTAVTRSTSQQAPRPNPFSYMSESYFNILHFVPPPPRHNGISQATPISSAATHTSVSVPEQSKAASTTLTGAPRPATVEDTMDEDE